MASKSKRLLLSFTAMSVVFSSSAALAGGFALREQSAYYQGMSFAGNGTTGPSISSMFWNPATITGAGEGFTFESHHTLVAPTAEITGAFTPSAIGGGVLGLTPSTAPSGDIGSEGYVPASYTAYKLTDQIFLGLSINAPYGLATKPHQNWAGQFYSRTSKVMSVNVTPTVGYKLNDMLSFAFGVQVQYFKVTLKSAIPNVPGYPSAILQGDDIGFGVTAGVTFKPFEGTELGLGFRSGVSQTLDGDIQTPAGLTDINASLITPEMINFSAKQRVTDAFRVFGTVEWANWSRLKSPRVTSQATGATVQTLHFNYRDSWFFAVGGEYDVNEDLTMRAGIGYEISPITDEIRSSRLPDTDRLWLSAGASYKVTDDLSFDLGYTYIHAADADINIGPGHQDYNPNVGSYVGKAQAHVNIISASMRYRWGGPAERPEYDVARGY
ncbi:OmpP1/FadL family transporter [Stappia indica]|uniref:Long-chain fatty acid transport protein n=1 Tax=Stappia indica TaxID=538381 RepID=A0A285R5S1_9HYPH|nr:OmpP1/FadL family transporter [Stappia indica]SOB89224.1 long-chain fatty acid transport protein [Stappia indica]